MNDLLPYLFTFRPLYAKIWKSQKLNQYTDYQQLYTDFIPFVKAEQKKEIYQRAQQLKADTERANIGILGFFDEHYPPLLKTIYDPPLLLFYRGRVDLLSRNYHAVVGTRKPSNISLAACPYVLRMIQKSNQPGIISGLAGGIDKAIMQLAMAANLPLIGVMATGMDKEYPFSNRKLYNDMKCYQKGLIVTEMRWGEPGNRWAFPRRNRIITGIATNLVILEAPRKSGAMSSANHALNQNRDILVFNHHAQRNNEGGRQLIADGARPIHWQAICQEEEIFHISKIPGYSYEKVSRVLVQLGKLESQGLLKDLGGGYYLKMVS